MMTYVWFGVALLVGSGIVWFVHHELVGMVKHI